jgi:hypothetical protein
MIHRNKAEKVYWKRRGSEYGKISLYGYSVEA